MPGDVVRIENCRPLSKLKRFKMIEVVREAPRFADPTTGTITTAYSDPANGIPKQKGWKNVGSKKKKP
jgi:hypothetical protein